MAEIAVQRRFVPGTILLFLLALAVLAGLLLWLSSRWLGEDLESKQASGFVVMDVRRIPSADSTSLIGRRVEVPDARVVSVTGDRIFWVGAGEGEQVLVVLNEVPTPGTPIEGRYDVNAGQVVTITGTLRRFPGWQEARTRWNADPAYRSEFEKQHVYVEADKLQITKRP